jgi:hypothetical protein
LERSTIAVAVVLTRISIRWPESVTGIKKAQLKWLPWWLPSDLDISRGFLERRLPEGERNEYINSTGQPKNVSVRRHSAFGLGAASHIEVRETCFRVEPRRAFI